jgi:hypothetical protein
MPTPTPTRQSEVARLTELLRSPRPGLRVGALSGPGGVGKSYLLAHVLAEVDLAALGVVQVSVDASNPETRGDFFGLLEALFRRSLGPPADPRRDLFPRLREVAALHRQLSLQARSELVKRGAPAALQEGVAALLKAGHALNRSLPRARKVLEVAARNLPGAGGLASAAGAVALELSARVSEDDARAALDEAWRVLEGLQAFGEATGLPGPLRDLFGVTRKNRVRRDLFQVTAEALVLDLSAALGGVRGKDRLRLTQGAIPGAHRLLLVLDDYEQLAPLLGDFLVGALVPALARAPFDTLLLILGRDDLEATHVGWAQHGRRFLEAPLRLAAFDEATALQLLADAGIPEGRRRALHEATQGYPFLLSLVIEEAGLEADSALFLRRFHDRTTRWMSPREREWFERVCYLEVVNEDTLGPLFPGQDVRLVQDWFEREPSIRDPTSSVFRVRPLIRDKVLRYLELRSPSRHRERLGLVAC